MTEEFTPKFRKGDRLVCMNAATGLWHASTYKALGDSFTREHEEYVVIVDDTGAPNEWGTWRFQLAEPEQPKETRLCSCGHKKIVHNYGLDSCNSCTCSAYKFEQPKEKKVTITLDESVAKMFLGYYYEKGMPLRLSVVGEAIEQALPTREVRHIHRKCAYCDSDLEFKSLLGVRRFICLDEHAKGCQAHWVVTGELLRFPDGGLVEREVKS